MLYFRVSDGQDHHTDTGRPDACVRGYNPWISGALLYLEREDSQGVVFSSALLYRSLLRSVGFLLRIFRDYGDMEIREKWEGQEPPLLDRSHSA